MTVSTQIMTEADTCRELVTPRLVEAGWSGEPHVIGEQRTFTNGRVVWRQLLLPARGASLEEAPCVIHAMSVHGFTACRSKFSRHAERADQRSDDRNAYLLPRLRIAEKTRHVDHGVIGERDRLLTFVSSTPRNRPDLRHF